MFDNSEAEDILTKLEELEDEELAVKLLKDFNDKTQKLGKLLLNQDTELDSLTWKKMCDQAKKDVDDLVEKINSL